jgi:hypothetical protein
MSAGRVEDPLARRPRDGLLTLLLVLPIAHPASIEQTFA